MNARILGVIFILNVVLFTTGNCGRFYKGKWFQKFGNWKISNSEAGVKTYWFNQTLDHFNPSDSRTWQQRYFMNDTFYKPGGPIFLMIGGEGEDNPQWMSQGSWIDYAEKLNAFCFSLEHRFYGKSHPTVDLSLENLEYLTSEQALGDLARFTQSMIAEYNFTMDDRWIAFGGSYPGSLAAWYRLKYPHLVHASVSTSAPLRAKLNFKEYLGVVRDSIHLTNPKCITEIQSAVRSLELLLRRRSGWWMIKNHFKTCGDFRGDNSKDVANFFETIAGNFMDIVQYNEDNRAFEGSPTGNITIKTLCDIMTRDDDGSTSMERYAAVNDLMLKTFDKNCTDISYSKLVKEMQQEDWDSSVASGERQWTYQTCNEFGFFQSSDLTDQPFGNRFGIDFSIRQCQDVFGMKYDRNFLQSKIDWTNVNYGGKVIKVSRVIFVNGSIDPWHALGITNKTEAGGVDNEVVYIEGTAHCANMYPDAPSDLPQLRQARADILEFLTKELTK